MKTSRVAGTALSLSLCLGCGPTLTGNSAGDTGDGTEGGELGCEEDFDFVYAVRSDGASEAQVIRVVDEDGDGDLSLTERLEIGNVAVAELRGLALSRDGRVYQLTNTSLQIVGEHAIDVGAVGTEVLLGPEVVSDEVVWLVRQAGVLTFMAVDLDLSADPYVWATLSSEPGVIADIAGSPDGVLFLSVPATGQVLAFDGNTVRLAFDELQDAPGFNPRYIDYRPDFGIVSLGILGSSDGAWVHMADADGDGRFSDVSVLRTKHVFSFEPSVAILPQDVLLFDSTPPTFKVAPMAGGDSREIVPTSWFDSVQIAFHVASAPACLDQ